jgi:endonuclease IV
LVNFQEIMNLYRIHSHPIIFSTPWENMTSKTIWSSKT